MGRARTKALDISPAVKRAVWERDGHHCIICGRHDAAPNAHFIARSQGGLGIEQNIVTLCLDCHSKYDNSEARKGYRIAIRHYLMSKYPDWDERDLYYKKGELYDKDFLNRQPDKRP